MYYKRISHKLLFKSLLVEALKEFNVEWLDQIAGMDAVPYDSKSNGSVENAIRQVQGFVAP